MNRSSLMSHIIALTFVVSGLTTPVNACIHGPAGFKGNLSADAYRGVLFHSGQREELILFTNLEFDKDNPPKNLAWILALPTVPDHYSADIKNSLFDDALALIPKPKTPLVLGSDEDEVKVALIKVGPYHIHQVSASGSNAVKALNAWFKKNGFATKKERDMKFFIDRKYTYLCVKVDWNGMKQNKAKKETVVEGLPPLRISFKTDRPFVPLKFSSHQGPMSLGLVTFTKKPLDWLNSARVLKQVGFQQLSHIDRGNAQNLAVSPTKFRDALKATYLDIIKEKRLPDSKQWYFNAISADDFNKSEANLISNWTSDFYLELNNDPYRSEVRRLLQKAVRYISRGEGSLNSQSVERLVKLGEKAVPGIMQALARGEADKVHTFGLKLLNNYPQKITRQFLEAEIQFVKDLQVTSGASRYFFIGKILLAKHDKRGLEFLIENAVDGWSSADKVYGYPSRYKFKQELWSLLEKATGKSFGAPKKLGENDLFDDDNPWLDWFSENKDKLQWDKDKKHFVIKK